jgi:membrane protease YdiL (CAAX protease family)
LPLSDAPSEPAGAPGAGATAWAFRPWRVLLRAVLWLLLAESASICAAVLAGVIAGLSQALARSQGTEAWHPDPRLYLLIATIALQVTLLLTALGQGRAVGGGNRAIGLGAVPMRRYGLIAVFAGLMVAWVIAYVAAIIRFRTFNDYVATKVPAVLTVPDPGSPILLTTMLLLAVLGAPIAEELFFRGWLWTALRRSWSVWPTALCTAGLWLAIHAIDGPLRVLILLPTAILLCLARHHGGSVRASLLVHIVNNTTAVVIQIAARSLAPL